MLINLYCSIMPRKYCKFRNCNTTNESNLRMYRFPKDEKRCKHWLEVINNPDLNHISIEKLYGASICELHFKDWCFLNVTSKLNLVKNAVPVIEKPAVCNSYLPASINNADCGLNLKDSSAKILYSPADISELHFEDWCVKKNVMSDAVSIVKQPSAFDNDPPLSVHNLVAVSQQTESTLQSGTSGAQKNANDMTQIKTYLHLSDVSTSKEIVKRPRSVSREKCSSKKIKEETPASCKDTVVPFKLSIMKENFLGEKLTDLDLVMIQDIILKRIDSSSSEGPKPLLKDFNLGNGVLVYTCLDEASCLWLKETLEGKIIGSGSPLQVINAKKIPHPAKVIFCTKDVITTDTTKLLKRMQFFNSRLQVRCWSVLDKKRYKSGQRLVLQVDGSSFTAIEEANFKAFTGVDEGTFKVLEFHKSVKSADVDPKIDIFHTETLVEDNGNEPISSLAAMMTQEHTWNAVSR